MSANRNCYCKGLDRHFYSVWTCEFFLPIELVYKLPIPRCIMLAYYTLEDLPKSVVRFPPSKGAA